MKADIYNAKIKKDEWIEIAIPGDLTVIVYGDGNVTVETAIGVHPYGDLTVNLKKRLKKKLKPEVSV